MGGAKFGQVECAKFLQRCETDEEAFAVLCAYATAKYARGSNTAQVARKLHLALCYFRAIRMHDVLARFGNAFVLATYHVRHLDGQALGACAVTTAVGVEAWNVTRRVGAKRKCGWQGGAGGPAMFGTLEPIGSRYSTGSEGQSSSVGEAVSSTWPSSEDPASVDLFAVPDYPPPDLPSYGDAAGGARTTGGEGMSVSWLR